MIKAVNTPFSNAQLVASHLARLQRPIHVATLNLDDPPTLACLTQVC
jgi:hypothetical protein